MANQIGFIVQVLAATCAVSWACWYSRDLPWMPIHLAGLVLLILGYVFWLIARFQLGRSFAVQAKAKELVTHGLYSKIRNPIYVFGSILIAGFLLLIKPIFLLLLIGLVPLQMIRARKEGAVLEEKFGDAYREYRSKTWF